jgi:GH15 family glucan-1,4-alpha-glucosidase
MSHRRGAPGIEEYAVIGDCRSAALVSRGGSIDWLCWPRFDSPSIFAALLDDHAGRWSIAPRAPFRSERRYLEGTNVLETRFLTDTGTVVLTDLMPVASEEDKRRHTFPGHEIVRMVRCERGEAEIDMAFAPRPEYARRPPRIRDAGALGLRIETPSGLLVLRTDMPLELSGQRETSSRIRLRAGEVRYCSLTFADEQPAVVPPLGRWTQDTIERSVAWWRDWTAQLTYDGPERDAVVRSALVLKLLVYAPSGAIVAAPTTSLPERVGGGLNWDYRFCWLRDASMTVRALFGLGYAREAEAFVSWLLHSTRLTRPELRILYDVYGNPPKPERTLDHFAGYRGSRPVRIDNAASDQVQLDVYGEVVDAVSYLVDEGGAFDRETQRMLSGFGEYVCRNWRQPDHGIWEPRSGKAHHTHSRVLCWTALDCLLQLHAEGRLAGVPADMFERNREIIRRDVEQRAWNAQLGHYAATLDGGDLDASLLLLPWYGFAEASSSRMKQTAVRITEHLGAGDGLLYRYRTGESPGEGAFGVCGFWGAEYLALGGGTVEEARRLFRRLVAYGNDVGLFAEEIDPATGDALGNFPQAFTHIGLINAALSLQQRLEGRRPRARRTFSADAAGPRQPAQL